MAAHITAASPGGPRWDVAISAGQRTDVANGIWLCQTCAKVIDDAPLAFTEEGLRAWKQHAEVAAARDSNALADEILAILTELDQTHDRLVDFGDRWQAGAPPVDFDNFQGSTNALALYLNSQRSAYQREIAPGVTSVISRSEIVLGVSAPRVLECKRGAMSGPTNYIGMRMLADTLQRLRVALSLR